MAKRPIKHLRWYIVILLSIASELNYMDRATLSVVKEQMQKALHFDDKGYAMVGATFLWVYAFAYLAVGWIVDRIGSRKSMLLFVSGWSIANMLHAFTTGVTSLAIFRAMLATMEPGSFPAGMKAVSEWFPMRDRALATGIFIAGTSLGTTLAIPIANIIAQEFGWQAAFIATGAVGLIWALVWYLVYQTPENHARLSDEEKQLILAGRELENQESKETVSIWRLVQMRETWGCALARICTDPISYFLSFWGPSYIRTKGGYIAEHFTEFAWIPFAAMMLGYMFSGAMPKMLMARGWELSKARKTTTVGVSLAVLVLWQVLIQVQSPEISLVIFAAVCFGHGAWGNMTFPAEVFPKHTVGTVTGFGGFLGAIVGGFIQLWIGYLTAADGKLTEKEYAIIFSLCSVAYITAIIGVHLLIGKLGVIRQIKPRSTQVS